MTHTSPPPARAPVVIDVQDGFDDVDHWGPGTDPGAEINIAALVEYWGTHHVGPVVVVRHDSTSPASPLHPSRPGNRLKIIVDADSADLVVTKTVSSAFYGTPDLHAWLSAADVDDLVLCGIQTNMCVETTARMAGNLGYRVTVALDATRTFDLTAELPGAGRITLAADHLMQVTAVNSQAGGFARISSTAALVAGPDVR